MGEDVSPKNALPGQGCFIIKKGIKEGGDGEEREGQKEGGEM